MENMTNEMFFDKIKNVLKEVLASVSLSKAEEPIEPIEPEALEAQEPAQEPQPTEEPKVEEPVVEEPKPQEEPKVEEPKPQEEAPKEPEQPKDNHLEELINSLKDEIKTLKEMNSGLDKRVKELSKQPSAEPVNVNAKAGVSNDNYRAWRQQMAQYLGH